MFIEQDNQTALHYASDSGHDEVVRVLLAAKAAVNTQDKVSPEQIYMNTSSISKLVYMLLYVHVMFLSFCMYSGDSLLSIQQVSMVTRNVLNFSLRLEPMLMCLKR